eukprot:5107564-Amphidinium_carterae.1
MTGGYVPEPALRSSLRRRLEMPVHGVAQLCQYIGTTTRAICHSAVDPSGWHAQQCCHSLRFHGFARHHF